MATMNSMKENERQGTADERKGSQGMGTPMVDRAKDTATHIADKAKEAASQVADKAKDLASNAAHRVEDMASTAEKKADSAVHSVGTGMEHLAGTIREKGPHDGVLGTASNKLANTLERGGHYLEEEGLSGMAEDLTNVIRRNPIPALFVGIGIGFLIARATSRR
jgi:hypothetical protein